MKFKEIASRITGLSLPFIGVSWNPPEADIARARRVIAFLEDRRVLYTPSEAEVPRHCVESILEIRRFLTQEIGALPEKNRLGQHLRAMRAACRKFLETVGPDDSEIVRFGFQSGHYASWVFLPAVGELRGVFGVYIAFVAAQYGICIEGDLTRIIPARPKKGDG